MRHFLAGQGKAVLFPESLALRIAPVDRKARFFTVRLAQFIQQFTDQR